MRNNKNYLYIIKSVQSSQLILVYSILDNNFILLDKNKSIINDSYISNFELHYINKDTYNLVYTYNYKKYKKIVKLIFSSKNHNNPLLFNMYIKHNNNYQILKSCCDNELCDTHYVKKIITNITSFNKKSSYVFYLSYKNLMPCRIRINNNLFNVLGYTKTPNPNNLNNLNENTNIYNITCNVDRELENSYKVSHKSNCKYINFKDNIYNNKLEKCSVNNNKNTLLSRIPKITEIFNQLIKKNNVIKAGQTESELNQIENTLDNSIGDQKTKEYNNKLNKTLTPEYKSVLKTVLEDFNNLDEDKKTAENYKKLLTKVYENSKEYKLLGKYKMCKGVKLTNVCNIENVVQCQDKCNQIHDCAHLSYDRNKKVCKLYNTCSTLKDDYNHMTYSKKSILRNNGYNLYNSFLLHRNTPIPNIPLFIRVLMFICGTVIVIILSTLLFRFIKIIIKFILCFYYDTCYSPTELFNIFLFKEVDLKKRYI